MSKYVELDKIKQFPIRRDHYDRENGSEEFINGIESVIEYIENWLPKVEVVYCCLCKWWDESISNTYNPCLHKCRLWRTYTALNDYCSRGESKECGLKN